MKKLLLTCALVGAVTTAAFAQGTVQFSNGTLSRLSLAGVGQIPLTENINFGLFYGTSSSDLQLLPQLGVNSSSSLGIIASAGDRKTTMTAMQLPGTTPGQDNIWIQIRGWDGSFGSNWQAASVAEGKWYGESVLRDVGNLGPATGPGLAIWQSATGTSLIQLNAFALSPIPVIPEPGTMVLAGLGLASLLIFRRRK